MTVLKLSLLLCSVGALSFSVGLVYLADALRRFLVPLPPDWTEEGKRLEARRLASGKRAKVLVTAGAAIALLGCVMFFVAPAAP